MFLYEVMTPREIELEFTLPHRSVIRDLHRNKFRSSEIRKSGSTWLITRREALRVYKKELTMIKVKTDWEWVSEHIDEELENEKLREVVEEWANKHKIDINRVKELYHDGLIHGSENGKYLPFAQWFYEYKENQEEWEDAEKDAWE